MLRSSEQVISVQDSASVPPKGIKVMVASLKGRALSVLGAYGMAVLGALIGGVLRLFGLFERPVAAYHCYDWQPQVLASLVAYVLVTPLAAYFVTGRSRSIVACAVGIVALILATFLWSYTKTVPCSPM